MIHEVFIAFSFRLPPNETQQLEDRQSIFILLLQQWWCGAVVLAPQKNKFLLDRALLCGVFMLTDWSPQLMDGRNSSDVNTPESLWSLKLLGSALFLFPTFVILDTWRLGEWRQSVTEWEDEKEEAAEAPHPPFYNEPGWDQTSSSSVLFMQHRRQFCQTELMVKKREEEEWKKTNRQTTEMEWDS